LGAILCKELVDVRMAELTAALGHDAKPDLSKQRLCTRCQGPRGSGHKWCEACRTEGKKDYSHDYYQRNFTRKSPSEVSAARRRAVAQRWGHDV
jgi:DnaJ-class molecular chaperone